jgi:hypothetical protein
MNDLQWHSETTFCPFVWCNSERKQFLYSWTSLTGWTFILATQCFYCENLKGCGVLPTYKERTESNACFLFYFSLYKLDVWKFHGTSPQHCWKSHLFFGLVSIFCRPSSISKQEHVFPPGKSFSSSATTGALRSAVPRHWLNCVLFGFLTTINLIIWWRKVRTVGWIRRHYPSQICDDLRGAHCCMRPFVVVGHCLWEEFD